MRKSLTTMLTIGLVTVAAGPAVGQNVVAGVRGGVVFADLGGDFEQLIETKSDFKTGFSVGAFLGADLHRMFRLEADVQYVQKGAKASLDGNEAKFKVTYVEVLIPLTLRIPAGSGAVVPRLYVGPSLGFELGCKISGAPGVTADLDCVDANAPTKSTSFGAFAGGGLDIAAGSGAFTVDALYNLGISDINDFPDDPNTVKNRGIQVLVGYAFRLGS